MAWLLWMKRPRYDLTLNGIRRRWALPKEEVNESIDNRHYKSPSAPLLNNTFKVSSNNVINIDRQSLRSDNNDQNLSRRSCICDIEIIRCELRVINSHLAILAHQTRQEEEDNDVSQDWRFVAMVVDRLCLILFTISMALFTVLTVFSTPNFFKLR